MNYRIFDKGSFKVVGKQRKITMVDEQNFNQVPKFWYDLMKDGSYEWILNVAIRLHHNTEMCCCGFLIFKKR